MNPTDEELLQAFYTGNDEALEQLMDRHDPLLSQVASLILTERTGSSLQVLHEWDVDDRTAMVWTHVMDTRQANLGLWPRTRLSVLTWLIYLLCLEMDRHLGFQPPY